jgi:hypothetical protein
MKLKFILKQKSKALKIFFFGRNAKRDALAAHVCERRTFEKRKSHRLAGSLSMHSVAVSKLPVSCSVKHVPQPTPARRNCALQQHKNE